MQGHPGAKPAPEVQDRIVYQGGKPVEQAPGLPGVYPFQWQMVQDGVRWFGEPTAPLLITVITPDAPPARH